MKIIYKWNKSDYTWEVKLDDYKIDWKWSQKKEVYYYKVDKEFNGVKYMIIWLKNWYTLIYQEWKALSEITPPKDDYYTIIDKVNCKVDISNLQLPF